jgi:hypothetical protein
MDRRVDTAVALAVAVLGGFILVAAQGIKEGYIPDPIGSRGVPSGLGALLLVGGSALALRRIINWRKDGPLVPPEGKEDDLGVAPGSARRAMTIWALTLVYVVALRDVGFLLTTVVYFALVLRALRYGMEPLGRIVPTYVVASVAFTATTYLVFAVILGVRLPQGIVRTIMLSLSGS